MAAPIKITDKIQEEIIKEVIENLKKSVMFNGKVSYEQAYTYPDFPKADIVFSPVAWIKMCALVDNVSSEIAWNGTVRRDEKDDGLFYIEDIMIYPQTVSSVTVTVDEVEYANWQDETFKTDEEFMSCRFQGHSHVDMSPSPSGVDLDTRKNILKTIGPDDYYIFMIINKKKEFTAAIYDMKCNVYYESDDINVRIGGLDYKGFVKESKEMVKTKVYNYSSSASTAKTASYAGSSIYTGSSNVYPLSSTSKKEKSPYLSEGSMMFFDDDEIEEDMLEYESYYGKDWWSKFGYSSKEEYIRDNYM